MSSVSADYLIIRTYYKYIDYNGLNYTVNLINVHQSSQYWYSGKYIGEFLLGTYLIIAARTYHKHLQTSGIILFYLI